MIGSLFESVFDLSNLTFTTFALVFTVCVLVQRLFFSGSNTKNLPPCPSYKLPVIGHLHVLEPDLSKPFRRFRKQLGDVYRLELGSRTTVVISGFDAIKDALIKNGDNFVYRPVLPVIENLTRGAGLLMANGEKWKEHRRFTLTTMKDFGMGKSSLEGRIHEEIQQLFEAVDAENGRPFNPKHHIQTNVANIICSMIFGSTFKHGDDKFKALVRGFEENLECLPVAGLVNFIPALGRLPGDLFMVKKMLRNTENLFRYTNEIITEHIDTHDEDNISDYVGAYVQHLNSLAKSGTPTTFSVPELASTIADLFVAGSETTTTALMWSLPLLASHPEIQDRMFKEIQTQVGTERLPAVKDKTNLVYVEAFYMEVLRYTVILNVGLSRTVGHEMKFRGYTIPSDAIIFIDMDSVLKDPTIWMDPEEFRPSRFIDESGHLRKMEEFVAFSLGKRNCVGESLARMELLLFVSALVQRYELVCPEGADLSMKTIDGIFMTVHGPKPYDIIFRKR